MVLPQLSIVIFRRGSTRRLAGAPISLHRLSTILLRSTARIPTDLPGRGGSLIDTYLIANAVDGLPPGKYCFDGEERALEQLKEGHFRDAPSFLCLEQPLFGDASVVLFLMADLEFVLSHLGNWG